MLNRCFSYLIKNDSTENKIHLLSIWFSISLFCNAHDACPHGEMSTDRKWSRRLPKKIKTHRQIWRMLDSHLRNVCNVRYLCMTNNDHKWPFIMSMTSKISACSDERQRISQYTTIMKTANVCNVMSINMTFQKWTIFIMGVYGEISLFWSDPKRRF